MYVSSDTLDDRGMLRTCTRTKVACTRGTDVPEKVRENVVDVRMGAEKSAVGQLLQERGFTADEVRRAAQLCPQLGNFQVDGTRERLNYISFAAERGLLGDVSVNDYIGSQPWVLNGDMDVVHEDQDILVINKNFDIRVDIPKGEERKWIGEPTVVDWLADRYADVSRTSPKFVNQLDYGTSGLMVIGRTKQGASKYSKLFQNRLVSKEYTALCFGHPTWNSTEVTAPIRTGEGFKMEVASPGDKSGKQSTSLMQVLSRGTFKYGPHVHEPVSLIRVRPREGRRHQIRVHLAMTGHPICGDMTYAPHLHNKQYYPYRLYLHATKLQMHAGPGSIDLFVPAPFEPIVEQSS